MDSAGGYSFRAATQDDLDAVADVVAADNLDDVGQVVLGRDFVEGQWSRLGFDLAIDAWVAVDATGTVVGYGQVRFAEPDAVDSWGVVHPKHRGRGIGSELLDRIERRAAQMQPEGSLIRFRHSVSSGDRAAADMVRARGLHPLHHFWHMQIDLTPPIDPGPEPEGLDITGVNPNNDLPAVHAVLERAFVGDLSHTPAPFEAWVEEETGGSNFDPTLWLAARDEDDIVGVLTASAGEDGGWVDYLAVLASHRGRGIGAALLRRSFALFADRGYARVLVSVDARNPTGATGVYERVGMRVVNRWDLWERPAS
ncbi:MAG TPA: GNAT family N-acetyltransferase [Actinomycetota bacterium]|jgi:ribosomal protein S18 acetylase RimI-like enzyme